MASWYVFEPPATAARSLAAAEKAVFIKDAFSWGAFLVPWAWLPWRRMWLVFLAWLAATVAIGIVTEILSVPDGLSALIQLVLSYVFALEANALRAWTMRRRGWNWAGIACGADQTEAEYRYHEGLAMPAPPRSAAGTLPASRPSDSVLGVFPEPFGGRS